LDKNRPRNVPNPSSIYINDSLVESSEWFKVWWKAIKYCITSNISNPISQFLDLVGNIWIFPVCKLIYNIDATLYFNALILLMVLKFS